MKMINGSLLIVDDEEDFRETVKQDLQKEGYLVEMAKDGDDALEKIRNNGFDLVALDIRMPGKSWKEVLKTIKQSHQDTWVTMVSVVNNEETIKEAKELGAGDYIVKSNPIIEVLKGKIEATLTRLFAHQEEIILNQFEKEEEAYLQMEEELFKKYPEEIVAILNGKVVGHGKDEDEVVEKAQQEFGKDTIIYIRKVGEKIPIFSV